MNTPRAYVGLILFHIERREIFHTAGISYCLQYFIYSDRKIILLVFFVYKKHQKTLPKRKRFENRNYLFENCRSVKKTDRWTVFSFDRKSYALRTRSGRRVKKRKTLPKRKRFENRNYLFENCGARLAALRPYFFLSFILGSRVRKPAFLRAGRRLSSY